MLTVSADSLPKPIKQHTSSCKIAGDQEIRRNDTSTSYTIKVQFREAPWPSGRASDSGARGRGFDPHSGRRVVSLSKIHLPPKKYW